MPMTNMSLQKIITNIFGAVSFVVPTDWYIGMSSTIPTQAQNSPPYWNFTEPAIGVGGYARISAANNTTTFGPIASEPSAGFSVQNNITLSYPQSTAAWSSGTSPLIYAGLFDASTGGNLWAYGPLSSSEQVNQAGIVISFALNQVLANFT